MIEININDVIELKTQNGIKEKNNKYIYKNLFLNLNEFFHELKSLSFEVNFFNDIELNRLLKKVIQVIILFLCLLYLICSQLEVENSLKIIYREFNDIYNQISNIAYNIFDVFIRPELVIGKFNTDFYEEMTKLMNKNKYNFKNKNDEIQVLNSLKKQFEYVIIKFKDKLRSYNYEYIKLVTNCLYSLLTSINKLSLLEYIDYILNVILFSILDYNIQKSKVNNFKCYENNITNLSVPYLPKMSKKYEYTLVLDMDETLIHFIITNNSNDYYDTNYNSLFAEQNNNKYGNTNVGMFLLRPYAKKFLEELNNYYEIVIFTASTKEYCDNILNIIDSENRLINYRLYRNHVSLRNIDNNVKDISLLGRDLSKTIIVDNLPENYKLQQDNGLPINSWTDDIFDSSLKNLVPILQKIVTQKVKDVRTIIKNIKKIYKPDEYGNIDYSKVNNNLIFK